MSHTQAWLHEIEATDWGVYTHWITGNKIIRAFYPLTAEFFLAKSDQRIRKQLLSHPHIESVEEVERYLSIHDWKISPVLCIRVNPRYIRSTYEDLRKYWREYLHNADLSLWQQFCFQTQLFPYVYATIEVQNDRLQDWQLLEAYTDADYQSVPFRTLWLQPVFEERHLSRGKVMEVLFRKSVRNQNEKPLIIEEENEGDTIETSVKYIQKIDPDILFTSGGDTFIPRVAERAVHTNLGHLRLGRGMRPLSSYVRRKNSGHGHSYMSYGRVYHSQFGVYLDGGRHHYDVGNSFMWKDGNIDGIHELVRLGCSDPQRVARGTIGTTLSAVQMKTAYDRKILIPARKADAESFRPAWSMQSDVGGLVYSPMVGFHTNVTELDFLSMYPNIMVHKNVSPETINCKCCPREQVVPLTDHHVCTRRPGLISLSLENILNRRQHFKAKRNLNLKYDRRQKVLKWLLVTCFESKSIVPVLKNDELQLVKIGPFIDKLIAEDDSLDEISVVGVNESFEAFFNPIKRAFRIKSPTKLYHISLETGREFTVTGDHINYILANGELQEKPAAEIQEGDFIPVVLKLPRINPRHHIEAIPELLEKVADNDLDTWRIMGTDLSYDIQAKKSRIRTRMKDHHSDGALRSWLNGNFIPLRYFDELELSDETQKYLKVAHGRRGGGELRYLPAHYDVDGDLGFFLGYFIGDGSARPTYVRLSINSADVDLLNWFVKFFDERFGLEAHILKEPFTKMFTLQVNSATLVRILTDVFKIPRTRALGKHKVPSIILNGDDCAVFGFLRGLIASDGDINPKRNVIRIASCDYAFIQELAYLTARVGLYVTLQKSIPKKGSPMYALGFSGKETLDCLLESGYFKQVDELKIRAKESKIQSRSLVKDFPVKESGLLTLAQKARTARTQRISDRTRVLREVVRTQVQRIAERRSKLDTSSLKQLEVIKKLVEGDLGFARVTKIRRVLPKGKHVYCFEVTSNYPGFVAGAGGIFSHNCFGYTGYRNARFGRIESHEAISAYGRHTLTLAQRIAARYDLEVIAGIVDSIWLKRPDNEPIPIEVSQELRQEVADLSGLPVEHAADYHWIVFLPRRHEPEIGVLNRYYGLKTDGKFKIRGIEIRQSSSPPFIKKLQTQMLAILAQARTGEQFQAATKRAYRLMKSYTNELAKGKIPLKELLITIRPSRAPNEYVNNSRQAIAARQLANAGVTVEPGIKLTYLITNAAAQDPDERVKVEQLMTGDESYDLTEYQKLCARAYESLIPPEFDSKDPTLELFLDH
jgi:DNA polymerase elongation subunit (family B)